MKKTILFFVLVMMQMEAVAQKCYYTVDKKDDFTGEKINSIQRTNSGWTWISSKKGKQLIIEMSFMMAGENLPDMTPRDSVLVKLEDGTILNLKPAAEVKPVNGAVSKSTGGSSTFTGQYSSTRLQTTTTEVSTFWPSFLVDRSVYEKLSASEISVIRISFTGKPYDFDLTKKPLSKTAPQIRNDARCILQIAD